MRVIFGIYSAGGQLGDGDSLGTGQFLLHLFGNSQLGDEELIKTLQQSKLKKEQEIQSWTADIAKQGRASSTMVLSQLYEIAPELTGKKITA